MRKSRQGYYGKQRNPFEGRRILTDSDSVRQICTFPQAPIRDNKLDIIHSEVPYSSVKGGDVCFPVSKSNLRLSDSKLQDLSDYKTGLNRNTNNDSSTVQSDSRKDNCSAGNNENGHEQKIDSKIARDACSEQEQLVTSQIKDDQESCRIPKIRTGIACVRVCSQCLAETSDNRQYNKGERSSSELTQIWSTSTDSKHIANSDTDFVSCLSQGNTTKPSQSLRSSKETDRRCVCSKHYEAQRLKPSGLKNTDFQAVPCESAVTDEVKEPQGKKSEVGPFCKNKKSQSGIIHGRSNLSNPCSLNIESVQDELKTELAEVRFTQKDSCLCHNNHTATYVESTTNASHDQELKWRQGFGVAENDVKFNFSDDFKAQCDALNEGERMWEKSLDSDAGKAIRPIRLIDHLEQEESKTVDKNHTRIRSTGESSFRDHLKSTAGREPLKHDNYFDINPLRKAPASQRANQHVAPYTSDIFLSKQMHSGNTCDSISSRSSNMYSATLIKKTTNGEKLLNSDERRAQIKDRVLKERMDIGSKVPLRAARADHLYQQHLRANIAARLFMQGQRKLLSPFVMSQNTANVPAGCKMSSNAIHNAESLCKYRKCGSKDNLKNSNEHNLNLTQTAFLPWSSSLTSDVGLRRRTIPERSTSAQRSSSGCKETIKNSTEEITQNGWNTGICYHCGGRFTSNLCFASRCNKSTQTDVQEVGTKVAGKEETDVTSSDGDKQQVSWMHRLTRETLRYEDRNNVRKSTPSINMDCIFKPISSYPELSSSSLNVEMKDFRNCRYIPYGRDRGVGLFSSQTVPPDSKVSEWKVHKCPFQSLLGSPSKTSNIVLNLNRRTVSSTTIQETDVQETVRSCRSMSSLRDRNQSSLPNDHHDRKRQNSYGDLDTCKSAEHVQFEGFEHWSPENLQSAQLGSSPNEHNQSKLNCLAGIKGNRNSSNTNNQDAGKGNSFIGEYLLNLWENQYLCDVAVTVGGKQMMAHKLVLAAFSDAFCPSSPYTRPSVCFDIPDSTPEAVYQIFRYMYTSCMDINDDNLEAALRAALFMGVTEVVDIIKGILKQPDVHNYEKYAQISETLQIPFDVAVTKIARESLTNLADAEFFPKMPFDQLLNVLEEPNVMVTSEEDTLSTVLKWIDSNPSELRRAHLLMDKVVLESIPAAKLGAYMDQYPKIFSECGVLAIVTKAFRHHALKREASDLKALKKDVSGQPSSSGIRDRERVNCDEKLGNEYKRDARCDEILHRTNKATTNSSIKPSLMKWDRACQEDESTKGCYEGFRRPRYPGKFMGSSFEAPEPRTGVARSSSHNQSNASPETSDSVWADMTRQTGFDKNDRLCQNGREMAQSEVGGQRFTPRGLADSYGKSIFQRLGDDDVDQRKNGSTSRDGGKFKDSFVQNREETFAERPNSSMMPRRLQRLNFLSGARTSQMRMRSESGFPTSSSRNDNNSTGEVDEDSPLPQAMSSIPRRRGDGFWYRPFHLSETPSSQLFRKFLSPGGLSHSRRNNNTNNSKDKMLCQDEDQIFGWSPSPRLKRNLNENSQRASTPFQHVRSKTSKKKHQTRRQNSSLRGKLSRKSSSTTMFESILSAKTSRHNKRRKETKNNISQSQISKDTELENSCPAEQTLSQDQNENFVADELGHTFPLKGDYRGKGIITMTGRVTSGLNSMKNAHTNVKTNNLPLRTVVETTPRKNNTPALQASENSFTVLGHDEKTSAFKKFIRW